MANPNTHLALQYVIEGANRGDADMLVALMNCVLELNAQDEFTSYLWRLLYTLMQGHRSR